MRFKKKNNLINMSDIVDIIQCCICLQNIEDNNRKLLECKHPYCTKCILKIY